MGESKDKQPAHLNADKLATKQVGFNQAAAQGNFALNNPNQTDQRSKVDVSYPNNRLYFIYFVKR